MKQAIVKLCALWCLLGTALPCVAVRLTLRQCLTLACMRSHHVALAGLAADIAAADYQQAVAGKYPPLSLQGGYSRLKASDPFSISLPGGETVEISPEIKNTYQLALQTDVPLFTGGALSSSIQGAAHGAAAARQQTRQTRVDLCLRVIYAYWDLYLARRSLVVIQENITHLLAVQRDVRNAFDQGMLLRSEVLDVAVRLAEVRVLAADTAHRVRTTQARLNALLGWPLEQEIVQLSLPLRQPVDRPLGDLYAMAVSQRPDVVRLQELYQQARYGLRAARANRYPQCSLKARAAYERPNYRNIPIRDEFQGHWEVGVLFAWTLWDWGRNRGAIQPGAHPCKTTGTPAGTAQRGYPPGANHPGAGSGRCAHGHRGCQAGNGSCQGKMAAHAAAVRRRCRLVQRHPGRGSGPAAGPPGSAAQTGTAVPGAGATAARSGRGICRLRLRSRS